MLTVLHLATLPFPAPLGTPLYVDGLLRALARRQIAVILGCLRGNGPAPETAFRTIMPEYSIFSSSGPHWSRPLQDLWLARRVRRLDVEMVHAHHVEGPVVARAAFGTSKKVIYHFHTRLEQELPDWWGWGKRPGRWVDRWIPRISDANIAISPASEAHLRRVGAKRVSQIPPGIEWSQVEGADPERARGQLALDGRPWLVYAGNTDPYQNLERLPGILKDLPDSGLILLATDHGRSLRTWVNEIPASRIRVRTQVPWSQVKDALSVADVGVLPRQFCSGFPMKLLNQLALGLPSVGMTDACPELPGVVRVPHRTELSSAIRGLLDAPERRRRLGLEGVAYARTCTWDERAAQVEALYRELLASP